MPNRLNDLPVVVLGGGACGMSAAHELARMGAPVIVLERESQVGGLCGTHERDGFRFDLGGHRFITGNAEVDHLVRELVGADLLERRRSSVILNGGKRYKYPLELDDVLHQYGLIRGSRALASYLMEGLRERVRPAREVSFRDWVTHRFGRQLYGTFFGPYTRKLWGIPPENISSDWAEQRISLPSLADVLWRLLGIPRPTARTYARRYLYPRRGIGQIFARCAAEVERRGGEVRTNAEVIGLDLRGRRVQAVRFRDTQGEHEIACRSVISTLSLPSLVGMLGPIPSDVAHSTARLRFRGIRLLNLLLEGPPVSPHTWMYVSEPHYLMARIQEPIHRSPEMAPPGATSLMLEIPCDIGDEIWGASDAALFERCLDDLNDLGLGDLRARAQGYFTTFVREGYPIYHVDYAADRQAALGHVSRFEDVISCGRQGAFRYIFMDTAMEMGLAAARAILAGRAPTHLVELGAAGGLHEAQALTA
jgi:protoporphyrinogen oxidase